MTNEFMATLVNRLQAPLVVSDILLGHEGGRDTDYALSALISDLQPDAALLAIALSVRTIVQPYLQASPILQAASVECDRIVEDFSGAYMSAPLTAESYCDASADTLAHVAEDLDYMEELLELAINFFAAKDPVAMTLCRLLKAQAKAQHVIAETFYNQIVGRCKDHMGHCQSCRLPAPANNTAPNNVMPFEAA